MKTDFLLENKYRKWGIFILVPSLLLGISNAFLGFEPEFLNTKVFCIHSSFIFQTTNRFSIINDKITNEIAGILIIVGLLIISFTKEKVEDEYLNLIRLKSLVLATYLNYVFLVFGLIFFYGFSFLNIMVYNMFTLLIFFNIIFYFKKVNLKKGIKNEE